MERTARASWVRHACIHYQALSGRARESVPKLQLGSVLTAPSNSGGEKRDGWMDGRVDGWTDGLVRDTVGDRAGWARKQHLWCIPYCPRMAHLGSHSGASSVSVEDVEKKKNVRTFKVTQPGIWKRWRAAHRRLRASSTGAFRPSVVPASSNTRGAPPISGKWTARRQPRGRHLACSQARQANQGRCKCGCPSHCNQGTSTQPRPFTSTASACRPRPRLPARARSRPAHG